MTEAAAITGQKTLCGTPDSPVRMSAVPEEKAIKGPTIVAYIHTKMGTIVYLPITGAWGLPRAKYKECIEALDILTLFGAHFLEPALTHIAAVSGFTLHSNL